MSVLSVPLYRIFRVRVEGGGGIGLWVKWKVTVVASLFTVIFHGSFIFCIYILYFLNSEYCINRQ